MSETIVLLRKCVVILFHASSYYQGSIQFNSIRIYFHQQRYKVFYKVYIYIKFVLQFVRNDNYTVIYGVYHMYIQ